MKTLITGGAGFIGSAIVPTLERSGYEINVVDNLSFGNREFIKVPDDQFYLVDIRDELKVDQAIMKINPEVIVHLAAIHFIPYSNQHPFEAADINIRGTMNILKACKKLNNLKKVFFASTAAVYPIYDGPLKEDHDLHPMDIYGLSKLTCEELLKKFNYETKVDTIVCRFFNAFGPNETNPHLFPEIEKQLRTGHRKIQLGNLTPKRDFIHTYDMAEAVRLLLNINGIGYDTFNLGRGIEYSVTDIVEAFERQLGEKIEIEVSSDRVRKIERMHLLADVTKLNRTVGWEPRWSIDDGIRNLIENWKK